MTKQEFIDKLISAEKQAGLFQGRFQRTHKDSNGDWFNDWWSYNRPAVDCFEPNIDLSIENKVIYINYKGFTDVEKKEYSYEDFLKLYKLYN